MDIENMNIELIDVSKIIIGVRSREVNEDRAKALAVEVKEMGLLHPITLWHSEGGPKLVAGAHRLAAFKLNGETHIPALWCDAKTKAEAKQLEVRENLARENLSAFDHARHLYDWKRAYEEMHPETKHGAHGGRGSKKNEKTTLGFSKYAAQVTDTSPTQISRLITIWTRLCKEAKAELEGSKFANRKADIEMLSGASETVQKKALKLLFPLDGQTARANSVREAFEILDRGEPISAMDKKSASLNTAMREMGDEHFHNLMNDHRQRVLGWAREQLTDM